MELYKLATSLYVRPVFDISKTEPSKSIYIIVSYQPKFTHNLPYHRNVFSNQLPQLKYNSYQYNSLWETTAASSILYDKKHFVLSGGGETFASPSTY